MKQCMTMEMEMPIGLNGTLVKEEVIEDVEFAYFENVGMKNLKKIAKGLGLDPSNVHWDESSSNEMAATTV